MTWLWSWLLILVPCALTVYYLRPRALRRSIQTVSRNVPDRKLDRRPTVLREPLLTKLGRAAGTLYMQWYEGWRVPTRDRWRQERVASLPPLLVQDISESVDLALFEREREAVINAPNYVDTLDMTPVNFPLGERGDASEPSDTTVDTSSDTTVDLISEKRAAAIRKAATLGLSRNEIVLLMSGNRNRNLDLLRSLLEETPAST
jgi:hypothetical protein